MSQDCDHSYSKTAAASQPRQKMEIKRGEEEQMGDLEEAVERALTAVIEKQRMKGVVEVVADMETTSTAEELKVHVLTEQPTISSEVEKAQMVAEFGQVINLVAGRLNTTGNIVRRPRLEVLNGRNEEEVSALPELKVSRKRKRRLDEVDGRSEQKSKRGGKGSIKSACVVVSEQKKVGNGKLKGDDEVKEVQLMEEAGCLAEEIVDEDQNKIGDVKKKVEEKVITKIPIVVEDIVDGFSFLSSDSPFKNQPKDIFKN